VIKLVFGVDFGFDNDGELSAVESKVKIDDLIHFRPREFELRIGNHLGNSIADIIKPSDHVTLRLIVA
jgi:hypothetical protein